jgi:predicted pyridoxine 5'-phosphate oxidase superfamily flavin-nucleotide-binding protein
MISDSIKGFIERAAYAFVASADKEGHPHLAAGRGLRVPDSGRLVFEAWFCSTTLRNLAQNPRVAVAVTDPASGIGYQLTGRVELREDIAVLDGYAPDFEPPGMPQMQSRLMIIVNGIMAFSAGAHTDEQLE